MALSSPNLTACGPCVFFVDAEGALEAQKWQKCRCAQTHTHLLGEVMTGHRSVGEKKNNELMMTHRRHASLLALTRMRAHKLINFLWDQESQQGYSSQKLLLKGQFTLCSLHNRPHSFHSILCPSYLVSTDPLTQLKRGSVHTSNTTSGFSIMWQDYVISVLLTKPTQGLLPW